MRASLSLLLGATSVSGGPVTAEQRQLRTEHQGRIITWLLISDTLRHQLMPDTGFWVKSHSEQLFRWLCSYKTVLTTWAGKEIPQSEMKYNEQLTATALWKCIYLWLFLENIAEGLQLLTYFFSYRSCDFFEETWPIGDHFPLSQNKNPNLGRHFQHTLHSYEQ